ncbi:MAG: flavin reductase family protein [Planctomycetota bacterium]
MELDPKTLGPAACYKLIVGCVVPRPIAFVSTISTEGAHNLAPFSFFNGVGASPMTILFCPANEPDGSDKDTLRNCVPTDEGGTGEFVVNVATEAYTRQMAGAAEPLPHGESEFELVDLTPARSTLVKPPRVLESPVAFECRTTHVIRTNPGAVAGGNVVIGEVVHVHIDDELVNERMHVDPERLAAVGRMGGADYCRTRERFALRPGKAALESSDPLDG